MDPATIEQRRQAKRALREEKKQPQKQQCRDQAPQPTPFRRAWRSTMGTRPTNCRSITLMTYNILAQTLCQRFIHPTAGNMLKWKTRRRMIMEEIAYYQPDLMCLQEVDNYDEFYKEALGKLGYTTLFHRHETKRHGCLIGYQGDAWDQVEYRTIDYDNDTFCKPAQSTGNIGQVVALAFKNEKGGVILGNTHLYWRPPSTYERCRQGLIYRHHLMGLQQELGQKDWVPLMVGDFNTQPSDPFYSIVTGRPFTETHLHVLEASRRPFEDDDPDYDPSKLDRDYDPAKACSDLMDIRHLLTHTGPTPPMQSVYSHHHDLWDHPQEGNTDFYGVGEPDYTNCAHVFKGTLDYIFIPVQAVLLDLLMLPPHHTIQPALPNQHFGSDHVCLMAKILLP